jgi:lysyl oxidase
MVARHPEKRERGSMILLKPLRSSLVVAMAAILLVPQEGARAAPAGTVHLPDIRTLPPTDLVVRAIGSKTSPGRELRFSTSIWNAGEGPLTLRPVNSGGTTTAYQRFWSHDAKGDPYVVGESPVGTFTFHPAHNHWHFDGFARYDLRGVNPDGGMGGVLRTTDKVSFCIRDVFSQDSKLPHYGWGGPYGSCSADGIQGISVGWGDRYHSGLAGQSIDITGLPDGTYWLVLEADDEDRLAETDDTNNVAAVKILLTAKGGVKVIG